ncbi:MAG: TolC family protein, partial [Candidatus Omnitrophota bacterium]
MKNRQILVAVLTAVCLMTVFRPLSAQTTEPLAFTDFLSKVRAHYPLLKKQHRRVEEAIAAQHEAIAGFLPRFTGVSAWTTGDDPVYVFGTLLKQGAFTSGDFDVARLNSPETRSNFSYGVEGRWMLFDAFDTISRVRGAGQRVRSETLNSEFADMETTLLAIEAFCRAALEENLGRFAREVQTASQKDLGEAESLSQKGLVLGADFYTAKVNGGLIERLYNRFERDFKSSRVVLNILMGQDPLIELALDYDIVPVAGQAQGLREWLQSAYLY